MSIRIPGWIPPYEPVKVQTLAATGTVIAAPGDKRQIVIEYTTAQNLSTEVTVTHKAGTVPFNEQVLAADEFMSISAAEDGKEYRLGANQPFVVTLSGAGSVLTNTRYWIESA